MKKVVSENKKNKAKFDLKQFKKDFKWYALGFFMSLLACPVYSLAAGAGDASLGSALSGLINTISPVLLVVGVVIAGVNVVKLMNKKSESQGEAVVTKEIWGIAGGAIIAAFPIIYKAIEEALKSYSNVKV